VQQIILNAKKNLNKNQEGVQNLTFTDKNTKYFKAQSLCNSLKSFPAKLTDR